MARLVVILLTLALGCGREETYTATGDVVAVDEAGGRVTLTHDDIPGLMPAMTMAFRARSPTVLAGAAVGTRVRFELAREAGGVVLTRLVPLGAASEGRTGIHDHTPHHGGVVTMVGMRHLEAVAAGDGRVRVYLTDVWRKPLPLADARGTVTLELPDGRHELALAAADDALEARGPPLTGRDVHAHVRVTRGDELLEAHYVLPLRLDLVGAAGVPSGGCGPPSRWAAAGRQPRCTMTFPEPVTFVSTTPRGETALVAVAGAGVSAWRMPAVEFLLGLEPPPAISAPPGAAPHADAVNAMGVSPDGSEVVVAIENRLLVHATASGRLVRELPRLRGAIRSVAWSPAGLLVTLFYDPAAHLLRPDDGREVRRLEVEREGAGVAASPDGRLAAVGSEMGPIGVFDLTATRPPELLREPHRAVTALEFSAGRLLSASADGTVRVWDPSAATVIARGEAAVGLFRLAVAPGGRVVASAGLDRAIRLHDVASGALLDTLAWHEAAVWGLAWAGAALISGDGRGELAVWDLSDRVPSGDGAPMPRAPSATSADDRRPVPPPRSGEG